MLGIVNQAIYELENKIKPTKSETVNTNINIKDLSVKDLLLASNNYIRFLLFLQVLFLV